MTIASSLRFLNILGGSGLVCGWTFLAYCFLQMMLCCAVFYNMMNYACYIGLFCNHCHYCNKMYVRYMLGGFHMGPSTPVVFVLSKYRLSELKLRYEIEIF